MKSLELRALVHKQSLPIQVFRKGQQIRIPGDDISAVINKLWKLELFSDINFYLTRIEGDTADIEIFIQELPTLSDFTITGVKKNKIQSLIDDTGLKKG